MCESCFPGDSISFKNNEDYKAFDHVLVNKIIYHKTLELVKFVKTGEVQIDIRDYEDVGYNVYRCLKCKQLWGFREFEPNQASFFPLTTSEIKKDEISSRSRRNRSLIILFVLIIGLVILVAKIT